MKKHKRLWFLLSIITLIVSCDTDTDTEVKLAAKLFYMPDCATINGYITLEDTGKTFVFQHEIEEIFQQNGIDVWVKYETEGPTILTAECINAEVVSLTFIELR